MSSNIPEKLPITNEISTDLARKFLNTLKT
jgi:hypothetical protein